MFRIIYLVSYSTVQKSQAHLSSTSAPRFACLMALIRYLVNFTFKILFFFFHGAFREIFSLSIIFNIADLKVGDPISNTVVWTYNPAHIPTSSNIRTKLLRPILNCIIFFLTDNFIHNYSISFTLVWRFASLRKPHRWGCFAERNVCDSATKISY